MRQTDVQGCAECVACLNDTHTFLIPCKHPICLSCAKQWLAMKPVCPTCRKVPAMLKAPRQKACCRVVPFRMGAAIGISFEDKRGRVCVKHIAVRGEARAAGLGVRDVVLSINNIPVSSASLASLFVESAWSQEHDIIVELLPTQCVRWMACLHLT